ncbi:glycoside hydrolase family 32 protein [Larkinella terrae]|uniref:Levanase n=1 Tax=Larkinella terrae TaxID=2025311 RepID=A0A7K0ERG4_9BACT|nr:glycoside hydrolase family 32 protein [Larkinella terrae]MRS64403.1 levanase [Larkinella terrae]
MKNPRNWFLFGLILQALSSLGQDTAYNQPFRPQYHFSPRINWTNDPNGLVYYDGEYHLFYQYNPKGIRWGHMTWGHAVSPDLFHWNELPPAIAEDEKGMIFSGSCVVDAKNTSGFGKNGQIPMVAIYTNHRETNQSQHLAYSLDRGRAWTKYENNPVIDVQKKDFRDPNVFWHEPSKRWVMTVVLPTEKKAVFYRSANLKQWEKTGEFASADSPGNIWECPALLEMPVAGSKRTKWLLLMSIGAGTPAGGSGMQYYIGDFDGKSFRSDFKQGDVRFVDYGKDYYAAITFNNTPRKISLGWLNNWQYANDIPTNPFRGAMTLPRDLKIVQSKNGYELRQEAAREIRPLTSDSFQWRGLDTKELNRSIDSNRIKGDAYVLTLEAELPGQTATGDLGVKVRKGAGEETIVGYNVARQEVYVDRTHSGQTGFKKEFSGRFSAPLKREDSPNGRIKMQIFVDRSSVEVFVNDGQVALTNLIFPKPASQGFEFFGDGFRAVTIRNIESVWP